MDLTDSADEAEFRAAVRSWLAENLPRLPWPEPVDLSEKAPFWRQWQAMLFEGGYAGLSWPREFGGQGADARLRAVFSEETDRAGAPDRLNTVGEDFAGPTIIAFGTTEQKNRFLPPILSGDELWCQLFSEPESGSDLASLRCAATRVEGGWRITGQKIWTSRAHLATNAILLARTGDAARPRHKGISYFLLPMGSPGVTVRPLRHMLGEAEFNEVFLDEVFVPDELLLGEENDGWRVAMATLGFERVGIATGRVNTTQAVDDVIGEIRQMRDLAGRPLGADTTIRRRVADLYGRAVVHHAISQRVLTNAADGGTPGPATSIGKLYFCPLVEAIADFRQSLSPLGGQLDQDVQSPQESRWQRLAYQARGTAIAGGSTFIQRNIVAERVLGLPRS